MVKSCDVGGNAGLWTRNGLANGRASVTACDWQEAGLTAADEETFQFLRATFTSATMDAAFRVCSQASQNVDGALVFLPPQDVQVHLPLDRLNQIAQPRSCCRKKVCAVVGA